LKSTVSLDARIFDSGNYRTPPIAPPRKKRSTLKKGSTLPTTMNDDGAVKNGFKDVFTNGGASRVLTYDEIENADKEQNVVQTRVDVEDERKESTLERKLRVGNKKTDKFFGESLSDHLSDEPVETSKKVSKDEVDRSSTSEKKLFFLMNMLESEMDEVGKYHLKEPVDEPLFVARKKEVKRHICDDDDYMHARFHHHEKEPCDHVVAPPKPDRDFSKYQGNVAETVTKEDAVEKLEEVPTKMRVKKTISRENLPTPPETPKRKSGVGSLPGTPTITIENIDFNAPNNFVEKIEESEKNEEAKQVEEVKQVEEKIVKRPPALNISKASKIDQMMQEKSVETPQTPILKHDMVDQMMKKAYGLHNYHPEDSEHNHDDGSNLVAPTSKLTTRKISVGRKISSESSPSLDGDYGGKSNELRSPDLVRQSSESPNGSKSPMLAQKLFKASSMNDILEEIYSKNSEIMQEFQSYLEASIEKEPVINVDEEKEFLEKKGISENEFVCTPEPPTLDEKNDENEDANSYSDSFESTDNEQETITEMSKIPNRFPKVNRGRRESIEDVDGWFNNHLDLLEKKSQLTNSRDALPTNSSYDTQKTFPFGRTITGRRESMSDEFFVDLPQSIIKPQIDTLKESESSFSEDEKEDVNKMDDAREKSPDHSTLLKYFDKDTKEN
jgi:hypothetical protein